MECEVRRRRRSFEIYGISVLELGVGPRRWIGRLRLHAGKYILGIAAPTGTGVQALPPWDPGASRSIPPISAVCCGVCVITRQAIKRTCCFHPMRQVMSAFGPKRTSLVAPQIARFQG
jgi:hypothetical protein